jgi:serine/threonine-protein kinase
MADQASLRDRVLAGRYRLDQRLGAGGMGSIWRAQHLVLAAPVAVKLIDREALPDEETIARFMREAQAAATLRSPHVVQILDYGIDQTLPFIVMELLEGENLAQRLRRVRRLTPAETARFVTQTSRAVQRAHDAGIIHRDLKPENVFLVRNEDEEIAKVLDFGVAKVDRGHLGTEGTRTRTGSILGTPYYMSPEQAQGNKTVDHRSDLWALGVIAFECITGKRPFYSDGLGDLVLQICIRDMPIPSEHASVPLGFDAWFAKAVARDPEQRFQSARELSDALREVLGVESRELAPEVVFSSGELSLEAERSPASQARTLVADVSSHVRLSSSSAPADENALTVAVVPPPSDSPQRTKSSPDVDAGPTRVDGLAIEPASPRSGFGLIVAVAATALAIGLAAGLSVLMMKSHGASQRPLPSAAPPAHAPSAPLATARPERSPARPSDAAGSAAAAAERSAAPGVLHPPLSGAPEPKASAAHSAAAPSAPAVDGGWVKPAWAIPDEEPKRVDERDH